MEDFQQLDYFVCFVCLFVCLFACLCGYSRHESRGYCLLTLVMKFADYCNGNCQPLKL